MIVTKIDVLDPLAEIPFCVDYKYKGSMRREFPADIDDLAKVEPVYKNIKGWQTRVPELASMQSCRPRLRII